jgi:hypothetical protein
VLSGKLTKIVGIFRESAADRSLGAYSVERHSSVTSQTFNFLVQILFICINLHRNRQIIFFLKGGKTRTGRLREPLEGRSSRIPSAADYLRVSHSPEA